MLLKTISVNYEGIQSLSNQINQVGNAALVRSHGDEFRDKFPDIQQLVTIMGAADDAYCKEYRVVTAEMLAKLCAKSTADQDWINRLGSVANALSTVRIRMYKFSTEYIYCTIHIRRYYYIYAMIHVHLYCCRYLKR